MEDVWPRFFSVGTAREVLVWARSFANSSQLHCQLDGGAVRVPAVFLNQSAALCPLPALPLGAVALSVSNDNTTWSNERWLSVVGTLGATCCCCRVGWRLTVCLLQH